MVEPIEVAIGFFLVGLVFLELTGKTDFLGRRKIDRVLERHEQALEEESESDRDDGPRF